ncbi:MAG: hypothetical protein AAGN35_19920 [Bacteroidota bacterium]
MSTPNLLSRTGGIWFTIFMLGATLALPGQGIRDFRWLGDPVDGETFLGLGASRTSLANPAAPNPELHDVSAFTLYFDLKKLNLQRGKASFYYSNALLGDLVLLLQETFQNPNSILRSVNSSLSSGLFGWFNLGWNLTRPGPVQPFLGFNLNDYFLGSTYLDSLNGRVSLEPQGYHFAGGPLVGLRAALGKVGLLELRSTYALSYVRAVSLSYAERDDNYPKSHFFHAQIDFFTAIGVFVAVEHHRLVNRGDLPNATRRWDATLGYRLTF